MSEQESSRLDAWAIRVASLPRVVRIIVSVLVAALLAVVVAQVLTLIIGDAALYELSAANTVFIIAGVTGLAGYIWGWWALIGFDRDADAQFGRRAIYFVLVGVLMLVALVIWLIINLIIASLPPQIPL